MRDDVTSPAETTVASDAPTAMRLTAIVYAAAGINLYELRPVAGGPVPAFTAGAHVDVHLPNGLVRPYSLTTAAEERDRFVLGVKRDANSRGGSRFMHDELRVGTVLNVGPPRNHFPLIETAPHSVLIAGGIGITPILCMVARLARLGASWHLHYAVRERTEAAFLDRLSAHAGRVDLHVDAERNGVLDVAAIAAGATPGAHLYCCGPEPMLQAFERATEARPRAQVHLERFTGAEPAVAEGAFVVELARSGRRVTVAPGRTVLEALRAAGVDVRASCEQGVCGTCETRVLSGVPDHRDMILSDEEKAAGEVMMICCSGCRSGPLVLDL